MYRILEVKTATSHYYRTQFRAWYTFFRWLSIYELHITRSYEDAVHQLEEHKKSYTKVVWKGE